jgi:hypothetical protein
MEEPEPSPAATSVFEPEIECGGVSGSTDVTVINQAGIDALAGCATIRGSLTITFSGDLDLRPLAALQGVERSLTIEPAVEGVRLSSLHGLERLRRVGGELHLSNVDGGIAPLSGLSGKMRSITLMSVRGARSLGEFVNVEVEDRFDLNDLPELESIEGLVAFRSLYLYKMPRLQTLAVPSIPGGLASLSVKDCATLRTIALPAEPTQLQYLHIEQVPELTTLAGISYTFDTETLWIEQAPRLSDLGQATHEFSGLRQLRLAGCSALLTQLNVGAGYLRSVTIENCDGLTELDELAGSSPQQLEIADNDALTRLPVLSAPTRMLRIQIRNNAALVTGAGFPNLEVIGSSNPSAETTELVESVGLEIVGNPVLTSLGDFPRLRSARILTLNDNAALASVDIPSLQSLERLQVQRNAGLLRLQLGVQSDLGIVELTDNPNLSTLVLGEPAGPLDRLLFKGHPALPADAVQNVLDLVGPETIVIQ